jgi:aminoglycoside phosphotransferase family enzyme/predicted kinase
MMSLITNLQNSALFDHPVKQFEVIETHISWVLLTGDYAYKIKKPVDYGFLDFSTLEKRHYFCKEELRLNRRLAPELYLDVVSIRGTEEQPIFTGTLPVIEYAVKMRQFPQEVQLDRILEAQGITPEIAEKIADKVARFHLSIKSATNDQEYGDLEHIRQPVLENFKHIQTSLTKLDETASQLPVQTVSHSLELLEGWSKKHLESLSSFFQFRKQRGFVRECHGDMHLRNIALWNNDIVIFDCIEFNKNFYWIDVVSEIAFLLMDLEDRRQQLLAMRFLNAYLEITGDYEGIKLLRFYKVYRAMVRAKVNALRILQEDPQSEEYAQTCKDFFQYLNLAEKYVQPVAPCLLINHGLSGSGKTYSATLILEKYPAIRVRSDVERKRIFNIDTNEKPHNEIEQGIYSKEATQKTYARLVDIAKCLLQAGYTVIIDAANLKSEQRRLFIDLAKSLQLPYFILAYEANVNVLRQRVKSRAEQGSDASDATLNILEHQIEEYQPFLPEEEPFVINIDTCKAIDVDKIIKFIQTSAIKF